MKSKKIIIFGLLILCGGFLKAEAATSDVRMDLELVCPAGKTCAPLTEKDQKFWSVTPLGVGETFTIKIKIRNPGGQAITSAQSWLNYDSQKLTGVTIETLDKFNLVAPEEKNFDPDNGRVKIGLANTSGGVNDPEMVLATVQFQVKSAKKETAEISFYDYQISELGHTNVNIMEDNFPVNILAEPPKSLVLSLNGEKLVSGVGGPPENFEPTHLVSLSRPTGLRATTGESYVYLIWDTLPAMGYHIFYGNKSGFYLHQLDASVSDSFYVTSLNNDQTYYFAVKAYDAAGNESDYSDEVAIIVNHPDTSTSPLEMATTDISKTKSGPSAIMFITLVAGIMGFIFSRKISPGIN